MVANDEKVFIKLHGQKTARVRLVPSRLTSIDVRLEAEVRAQLPLWVIQFYDDPRRARQDFKHPKRWAKRAVKLVLKTGVYGRMWRGPEGVRMIIPLN